MAIWLAGIICCAAPPAAYAQTGAGPYVRSDDTDMLKETLTERISRLSRIVSSASDTSSSLADQVTSGTSDASGSMGDSCANSTIGAGSNAISSTTLATPTTARPGPSVEALRAMAAKLSAYSSELDNLRAQVAAAPYDKALDIIGNSVIPSEAVPVLLPTPAHVMAREAPDAPLIVATNLKPFILHGFPTVTYRSVGALLVQDAAGWRSVTCTATLIAANAVLTAAHCVPGNPKAMSVYFQHAGIYGILKVTKNNAFAFPVADIAIAQLDRAVDDIDPATINQAGQLATGSDVTGVGFGYFDTTSLTKTTTSTTANNGSSQIVQKAGIAEEALIQTGACPAKYQNENLICWRYKAEQQIFGTTCMGDSGGPLFLSHEGQWILAGITTGGDQNCESNRSSMATEVYAYRTWIDETLRDSVNVRIMEYSSLLDSGNAKFQTNTFGAWTSTFRVVAGTDFLRVNANSVTTGDGLRVIVWGGPKNQEICNEKTFDSVETCDRRKAALTKPAAGEWRVELVADPCQDFQLVVEGIRIPPNPGAKGGKP